VLHGTWLSNAGIDGHAARILRFAMQKVVGSRSHHPLFENPLGSVSSFSWFPNDDLCRNQGWLDGVVSLCGVRPD
jgi:hypothetical protein